MKYIIMCGGHYKKWSFPRHLTRVNGEPMVGRTIRLLRENGVTDISISSDNDIFGQFGVPVLRHENNYFAVRYNKYRGHWCDAFYPTNEPTCYIFGDVLFSPEAIKTIVETETDDIMFFGSKPPFAKEYPKPHVEPFAFKVADTKRFREACQKVRSLPDTAFARKPIAWELWYVITDSPLKQDAEDIQGKAREYIAINDYTCDIDDPSDVEKITALI